MLSLSEEKEVLCRMNRIKYLCLLLSCLLLSGCADAVSAGEPQSAEAGNSAAQMIQKSSASSLSDGQTSALSEELSPEGMRAYGIILRFDSAEVLLRGEAVSMNAKPIVEDGILFLPVSELTVRMGGSFISAQDVFYLNFGGNVSAMMTEYNVMLFNSDSYVMDAAPFMRDGVFYLPADGAAKALSMRLTVCPEQQICVLGLSGIPKLSDLRGLKELIDGIALEETPVPELKELSDQAGADYDTVVQAASSRRLWQTDADGRIAQIYLDAAGTLCKTEYVLSYCYPPDMLYIASERADGLCLPDGTPAGEEMPDLLCSMELRAATGRYMELRATAMLYGDENADQLAAAYAEAIAGKLNDPVYQQDRADPYVTKLYADTAGSEAEWNALIHQAEAGDFLLFSSEGASAEYGFFNHSALILSVDGDTLHLLHARGSEYGVGADLDMDYLSWEMLCTHNYYIDYETVFLCTAGDLSSDEKESMVQQAYEDYNGYQFGYGGRMGLQEVNCTELIDNAYTSAGVEMISGDYDTRLKEVLKGNTKNLVVIPDDLMFSDITEVKAVWKR